MAGGQAAGLLEEAVGRGVLEGIDRLALGVEVRGELEELADLGHHLGNVDLHVSPYAGSVDATILTLPYNLQADKAGFKDLLWFGERLELPLSGLATLDETIQKNPKQVLGVVRADNTVDLRPVKLGRDFGPVVEILHGVGAEDRVIINPADALVAGAPVRVIEAAEKK